MTHDIKALSMMNNIESVVGNRCGMDESQATDDIWTDLIR